MPDSKTINAMIVYAAAMDAVGRRGVLQDLQFNAVEVACVAQHRLYDKLKYTKVLDVFQISSC
jgi:hypothetical protein